MAKQTALEVLNNIRQGELTAIAQYMAHHYYLNNMGYPKLGEESKKESFDEMKHAELLAERILELGGDPVFQPLKTPHNKKGTIEDMFKADIALEEAAVKRLNDGIRTCVENNDATSRQLLDEIVKNEEEHLYALRQHLAHLKTFGNDYLLRIGI